MPRALTDLEIHLRRADTLDAPARQAALVAVDDMLRAATRSGELLKAAQDATMVAESSPHLDAALQNAASLARQAYKQRTNAEVAKYRAAFALLAEQHTEESVSAAEAAKAVASAREQEPLIQTAKYHGKVRDLMLAASAATEKALSQIPPLPLDVAPMERVGPEAQVAQGKPAEMLAQPTFGWRPKKYSELMGDFFPANYKLAAGALSGVHGVSAGRQFGTADATQGQATGAAWWSSLERAIGYGVKAAGEAASSEGAKAASSDPAGSGALQTGGGILNVLSSLLGAGVNNGMRSGPQSGISTPWGPVLLVGGLLAVGGYALWRVSK